MGWGGMAPARSGWKSLYCPRLVPRGLKGWTRAMGHVGVPRWLIYEARLRRLMASPLAKK